MDIAVAPIISTGQVNVLVVGNNPSELSQVFESLERFRDRMIMTEIAFDLKSIRERLERFQPAFILIDDNIGIIELKKMVMKLSKLKKTKGVPITVLKNSNYQETVSIGVLNYILKKDLTAESLYRALANSLKFKVTQRYLYESYRKRTGNLRRFLQP